MSQLHPELGIVRWFPPFWINSWTLGPIRYLSSRLRSGTASLPGIEKRDIEITAQPGGLPIPITIYQPENRKNNAPAILWVHGGGMILGSRHMRQATLEKRALLLGATIIVLDYRLAPEHPAPAAIDDCYAAWQWMLDNAAELGIDIGKIAIGGESAGGGLAAVTAQRIHDRGGQQPVMQLLVYPMLDDRTVVNTDPAASFYIWTPGSNRFGWTSFLGCKPGSDQVPVEHVPARRKDLHGLPPCWIGVGSLDLFLKENEEYARRLREAGVKVELEITDGAFHGFDEICKTAGPSIAFNASQDRALGRAFGVQRSE